jgi:hypothetical protein
MEGRKLLLGRTLIAPVVFGWKGESRGKKGIDVPASGRHSGNNPPPISPSMHRSWLYLAGRSLRETGPTGI